MLPDSIDTNAAVYAIYNIFDIASHYATMRQRFPEWTEHQVQCVLYWQPRARKQLRSEIQAFLREMGKGWLIVDNPEAQSVNLTATMEAVGILLEWPPVTVAYQIALAGVSLDLSG